MYTPLNLTKADTPQNLKWRADIIQHYDSLAALENVQPHRLNVEVYKDTASRYARHATEYDFANWYGETPANLIDIISRNQWHEGLERMQNALDSMDAELPPVTSIKRRRMRGDSGDSVDMSMVWAGRLESAWTRTERRTVTQSRMITLTYPLVHSGGTETNTMFWTGAAMLKIADLLTSAGYSVQIIGCHGTAEGKKDKEAFITVQSKPFNAPLDMQALIIPMCFAGYMRTVAFEAVMAQPVKVNMGLGRALYGAHRRQCVIDAIGGDIYSARECSNEEHAREHIKKTLDAIQGADIKQAA